LRRILRKYGVGIYTVFNWAKMGHVIEFLWSQQWTFEFHKNWNSLISLATLIYSEMNHIHGYNFKCNSSALLNEIGSREDGRVFCIGRNFVDSTRGLLQWYYPMQIGYFLNTHQWNHLYVSLLGKPLWTMKFVPVFLLDNFYKFICLSYIFLS
jgi:hypothetical protein